MLTDLRVDRRDHGVVLVTLDAPDRRNAMSTAMTASWGAVMADLRTDASVRCVVVTGAGSAFCAGGDTAWLAGEPGATVDSLRMRMLPFYRTWLAIRELEVPTIAAINGPAIGAGLCMALACDLRYAATGAKLAVPFTGLGMHPGMAATWLLPEVVGLAAARELLLTGRTVAGEEAVALGLVNRAFHPEKLLDEVLDIAAACRREGAGRHPADHHGVAVGPPGEHRGRPAVGGPRAAGDAGDRRPSGRPGRAARTARSALHRSLAALRSPLVCLVADRQASERGRRCPFPPRSTTTP